MPSPRQRQIEAISSALGDRTLAWFGIRGHDAAALLPIPQFKACYAVTAPLRASKLADALTMEELTGQRVDLDAYDIDLDDRPEVTELRRKMLARLRHPSTVTTYRPSHFLDAIGFASRESCEYLGLFKGRQGAFEHKPWVETQLSDLGVQTIPWRYVADEYRDSLRGELSQQSLILRASRKSGGVGIALVEDPDDLEAKWPMEGEHFIGVAPYLRDAIPINVGACVFNRETITVHPGSVQLVGIKELTTRAFGYCGNDFAAFAQLDRSDIQTIDDATVRIGTWLADMGYRGALGVDFLLDSDGIHFAEINARFQGSTALSATLGMQTDHVDIVLDHTAAFLGIPPTEELRLVDWVRELPPAAHVVVHNNSGSPVTLVGALPILGADRGVRLEIVPDDGVSVDPGAIMLRIVASRQLTKSGFSLDVDSLDVVREVSTAFNGDDF